MAVYSVNDIVSDQVLRSGTWEPTILTVSQRAGHAVDIGGNIGMYTFVLAKAGWNVTSFEAMPFNIMLQKATVCANPDVSSRIDLHEVALSDVEQHCHLLSQTNNVGDGILACDESAYLNLRGTFKVRGQFDVKRLDDVWPSCKFSEQPVDLLKMDVEGFECRVLRGASELLAQRPRMIQSELWGTMSNCTPTEFMKIISGAGYSVARDASCREEVSPKLPSGREIRDFWMCHTEMRQDAGFWALVRSHRSLLAQTFSLFLTWHHGGLGGYKMSNSRVRLD